MQTFANGKQFNTHRNGDGDGDNDNGGIHKNIECYYCSQSLLPQNCHVICAWDFNHRFDTGDSCKYGNNCHKIHIVKISQIMNQQIYFKRYDISDEPTEEYLGKITAIDNYCHIDGNWKLHLNIEASRNIGGKKWESDFVDDFQISLDHIEILRFIKYQVIKVIRNVIL